MKTLLKFQNFTILLVGFFLLISNVASFGQNVPVNRGGKGGNPDCFVARQCLSATSNYVDVEFSNDNSNPDYTDLVAISSLNIGSSQNTVSEITLLTPAASLTYDDNDNVVLAPGETVKYRIYFTNTWGTVMALYGEIKIGYSTNCYQVTYNEDPGAVSTFNTFEGGDDIAYLSWKSFTSHLCYSLCPTKGELNPRLAQESSDENITVYPNPVKDQLSVSFDLQEESFVSISVLNSLGSQVKMIDKMKYTTGFYTSNISIEELPKGIYYVTILVGDKLTTQKIVKI